MDELSGLGSDDMIVIAGGLIPGQDYEYLYEKGGMGVFGHGTKISKAAIEILNILLKVYE